MIKFSANLGFLWTELSLPDAIRRAKEAGFEAVECHFPYDLAAAEDVAQALKETGLSMLGINTRLGVNGPEDFGVLAMPGREEEAQSYIDEAIAYGSIIGVKNINCVPGRTGRTAEAEEVYRKNLTIAAEKAAKHGIGLVIEPINHRLATNFHCHTVEEAIETIEAVGVDNLKVMFDFFHTQIQQGDVLARLEKALPYVGHIQFAAIHDRGEPDENSEINYPYVLRAVDEMGWDGYLGAEYRPRGTTDEGLAWLEAYR